MEHETIQPISENIWWVIPGKLAGVRKPIAEELTELQTAGVQAIVSVMDDPSNLDLYQRANIPYLWLPIKGGATPSQEQLQDLQNFVESQNNFGKGVAIHCTNGRRRTGTMLASYLICSGSSYNDAIQTIGRTNPEIELREAQHNFLQELEQQELEHTR
ncbi:dual specificity protein phosphatase family protein [Nostoc commune]|uniref:phosphatase domain-containing putative toxin n=1 Tax=Nostoc commune TaxID=1178 RepID=UPI0018C70F30|nr:dual specificity protein phosphatase family protein [Nostoc commune]MBG1260621.1 protein phosphatase [Nostoc commune BAE]